MRNRIFLLIFTVMVLSCNGSKGTSLNGDMMDTKVISLVVYGALDDKGFNSNALIGVEKIEKDFNIKVIVKELNTNNSLDELRSLKNSGSNFVWLIGSTFSNISFNIALENPEVKYAIIEPIYGSDVKIPENLTGMTFRSGEGSFLAGYLAAKTTKTGKLGFIGGIKEGGVDSFRYGYEAGAKYANKNITISSQYIGNFTDTEVGKTLAMKMYGDGIDIIHHVAGAGGVGAIEAAKELGPKALIIGVDQDQSHLAPNNVLTSVTKNIGEAVYLVTSNYLKTDIFEGSILTNYGLKEGVIGIVKNSKMVPNSLQAEVDELEKKIISGEVIVPANETEYDNFLKNLI